VTINEFPLPDTANAGCTGITAGPDGNLWFTEAGLSGVSGSGNAMGQINPTTHVINQFLLPTPNNSPQGIALGSDGNLWFTEPGVAGVSGSGNKIGQINATSHVVTEFPLPTASSAPQGITAGPGSTGDLWFTEKLGNKIGQINPTNHIINEFPLPTANSSPNGIALGSDGFFWFTELAGRIGRINPDDHSVTEFPLPTTGDVPTEITPGPDGNLWFTIQSFSTGAHGSIGMINPHTDAITEFPLVQGQEPVGITTGSDDNLWFTVVIQSLANGSPQIGQINPTTHAIATFMIPTVTSDPAGITSGPDSNLWFAESYANNIGQVMLGTKAPAADLALFGSAPRSVTAGSNVTYNLTVTNNGTAGATGVTLSNILPSGVTFVSATGGVTPVRGELDFSIGSLAAGASASFTIMVTATAAGTLTDNASTSMRLTDPTPSDNSVILTTVVTSQTAPDLALTGSAPASGVSGTNVTYTLTATNDGTASATSVKLVDTLPSGVTFVSATGGAKPVNGVLTFAIGNLAAGAHTNFTIVVTPKAAGTLTDQANVSLNETDPTPADNSVALATAIASVQRTGIHGQPTTLVLRFGAPVDPAWAQNTDNYRLVVLGGSHRTIRVKSAVYDAATRTVTLKPVHRLNLHNLFRFTVVGSGTSGPTDPSGRLPNSSKTTPDGGSGFVTIISAADLVLTTRNPAILRSYQKLLVDQSAVLKRLSTPERNETSGSARAT
jgi:virginiamycin B lyase